MITLCVGPSLQVVVLDGYEERPACCCLRGQVRDRGVSRPAATFRMIAVSDTQSCTLRGRTRGSITLAIMKSLPPRAARLREHRPPVIHCALLDATGAYML